MPKRYELPDLRPRDLVRVATPNNPSSIFYLDEGMGGHWVHFDMARDPANLKRGGWDLEANTEEDYVELGRLRDIDPTEIVNDWARVEAALCAAALCAAAPLAPHKIGDVLTREQVAALPAGAVTQDLDEKTTHRDYVEQWNGRGEGRCVMVARDGLSRSSFDAWGSRMPRDRQRLVALGTPLDDRKALYQALATQGFAPAVKALADAQPAAVEVSATGTMVQVGDMVETTPKALAELPVGTVVHFWERDWGHQAVRTADGFRWLPSGNAANPAGIPGRQAVVIAVDRPDHKSALEARAAFVARPYKGQERAAALAAVVEAKITSESKAALDRVDQAVSATSDVIARYQPKPQVFDGQQWVELKGFTADDFGVPLFTASPRFLGFDHDEVLARPAVIGYREPMPEITTMPEVKTTMKLDMKTQTLQINVPRLPGEDDNAYANRAATLVKPQTAVDLARSKVDTAGNLTMSAEPSWLERAAEVLKPVAAELAAEAKVQTRQALALGGVEVARTAAHRGLAAAAEALAPQHAAKVTQIVDHPITRWLENTALFLGARAAGKPALAQVGLREVVRTPMEGAVGLLVQAVSQVAGAVKGALVAADEAAKVEQVTGQPEAAQVSAGEVRS